MNCPLCKQAVGDEGDLQLHYLYCSAYAETRPPGDSGVRTIPVRFRWVKTRPCIEQEVHLISSLAGSVTLRWSEVEGLFESEEADVPFGQHVCQLAVSGDVLPTEDFVVGEETETIHIILTQGNLPGDVPPSVPRNTSPLDVGGGSPDWLDTGVSSPRQERQQDLTLDIDGDRHEEHNPHDLSPLHKELIRHQVIHGEPSWLPRSGRQSPLLFEEEAGLPGHPDPPLLMTRPAYLEDLRSRSPIPLRHGVELTTAPLAGQVERERMDEQMGHSDLRSHEEDRARSPSASSSHSPADSVHSSASPSPVNSNADANESSAGSPFSEEQLLPQSRESPEAPPVGQAMEPNRGVFTIEVVGVGRAPGIPSRSQEATGPHLNGADLSPDVTAQSSSRASPLGSVLDDGVPGTGTSVLDESGAAPPDTGDSMLAQSPPARTSPTGSALSDSERAPGWSNPFTSPRTRSLSDINRRSHRMSPSTSLHSEPHFPLSPRQQELLLDRTGGWRTPERGPDGRHPGRSLADTDPTPAGTSTHRPHRESPPGAFLNESSAGSDASSDGNRPSSQGAPPLDVRERSSSNQRSAGSRESSRASSVRGEPREASESPAEIPHGGEPGHAAITSSPHSSAHTSPRPPSYSGHPPETLASSDVGLDDVMRESRDGSSPPEVAGPRGSWRSEGARTESTRSGSRTPSERGGSREDAGRMGPAGERSQGSSRASSAQSEEIASLLEILRRNEERKGAATKKAEHRSPRGRHSPGLNRDHERKTPEAAPARGAPFIPSRATAFETVSGPSAADVEALVRERDGLAQELKTRTAHFEQELRRLKMTNDDLEQQLLSVQMVAKLSEASEEKQKEAERALEALRNTRAEELGRLGQREAEIKRLRETGHEEGARSRVRIAELEKENRLLKEEQESLRTVQQIRNEDFDKARAELELELAGLRRSLHSASQRDRDEVARLRESNSDLRRQVSDLESENEILKRKLGKAKNKPAADYRISKARSETDLSAKRYKSHDDSDRLPSTRSVNFSVGTGSSGFGSVRTAWSEPSDDALYGKWIGRSSLTNGDHSAVGRSTSPYEKTFDSLGSVTRRRFGSLGDESEFSDVSDLDHDGGSRRRTVSSESSGSSLFSGIDRGLRTNGYYPTATNGYRMPRAYSPEDYGHAPAKRRSQRPHSFHGDVSVLGDSYRTVTSETLRHARPVTTSGYAPKILDPSPPARETSRFAATTRSHKDEPLLGNKPYAPSSARDVRVGSRVLVTRTRGKIGRGVVKYVGLLPGRADTYVGVELDQAEGKHDGSFDGQRFFRCKPNYGIFVSFNKVVMCYG